MACACGKAGRAAATSWGTGTARLGNATNPTPSAGTAAPTSTDSGAILRLADGTEYRFDTQAEAHAAKLRYGMGTVVPA